MHVCGVIYFLLVDLSLFYPNKAGAKHVYAVEASEMAEYAQKLIAGNPLLAQRITVRYFFLILSLLTFCQCHYWAIISLNSWHCVILKYRWSKVK